MKHLFRAALASALAVCLSAPAAAQSAAAAGDVYHVHFTKAVPGQGAALAEALMKPDATRPMPDHFIVLRHQQGDDWDFCVIQHLGASATVDAKPSPVPPTAPLSAWHTDTFVAGPPWPEFVKSMGLGGASGSTAGSVYVVGVWRAVAGHRSELEKVLREPEPSKVPVSRVVLPHLEGGPWQFMAVDRYNSWQDFATDQAQSAPGGGPAAGGWSKIREHSSFHRDTLTDRIAPK
jgi:hypothetical protein